MQPRLIILQALQSHVNIDWNATTVGSVLNLQPEVLQPHVNIGDHAYGVDSVRDLRLEASQSYVRIE